LAETILNDRNPKENRQMKKLMTLMAAAALTFGAVSMYAAPQKKSTTVTKSTKTATAKGTKTVKKSTKTTK